MITHTTGTLLAILYLTLAAVPQRDTELISNNIIIPITTSNVAKSAKSLADNSLILDEYYENEPSDNDDTEQLYSANFSDSNVSNSNNTLAEPLDCNSESSNVIKLSDFTDEELNILYKITQAEMGDYSEDSKINVVVCILNRVFGDYFPDTIKEVVFQNDNNVYQFSTVRTSTSRYYTQTVTQHTIDAVHKGIENYHLYSQTNDSQYFVAKGFYSAFHQTLTKVLEDDVAIYYK